MYMCSCQLHNLSTEYTALLPLPLLSTLNNSRNLLHLQKFWLHQKFPITAKDKDFWPFDPIRTVSVKQQLYTFHLSFSNSFGMFLPEAKNLSTPQFASSTDNEKLSELINLWFVLFSCTLHLYMDLPSPRYSPWQPTPVAQRLGSIQASEHLFSPTHSVSPFTNFIFQHFNLYISLCGMHLYRREKQIYIFIFKVGWNTGRDSTVWHTSACQGFHTSGWVRYL